MGQFIGDHFVALGVAYAVFTAAIQTLPEPLPMERWYGFFYAFVHVLGLNLSHLGLTKAPEGKK